MLSVAKLLTLLLYGTKVMFPFTHRHRTSNITNDKYLFCILQVLLMIVAIFRKASTLAEIIFDRLK